jgi:O-antigen ligase
LVGSAGSFLTQMALFNADLTRLSCGVRSERQKQRVYTYCENFTQWLLLAMVVFTPWAFGTTQDWAIWVMNGGGFGLGILLIIKWFLRKTGLRVSRWDRPEGRSDRRTGGRWITRTMAALTILFLIYGFTSYFNARAEYVRQLRYFKYFEIISWLPHTYDSNRTLFYMMMYSAIACSFWAARDWLLGKGKQDLRDGDSAGDRLPERMRLLLWVLAVNGAALAVEGILQRLEGSGKLLFLVTPRISDGPKMQFGPYAYRGNAAQYFNLVWPLCIALWWYLRKSAPQFSRTENRRSGGSPHMILLPFAMIIAVCPIVSLSRAGAAVALGALILITIVLVFGEEKKRMRNQIGLIVFLLGTLALARYLGWEEVEIRVGKTSLNDMTGREEIYANSMTMVGDFFWLGSGPGTFEPLYQLYLTSATETWYAQAHNDWLETLITFGIFGLSLLLIFLVCVVFRWFFRGGIVVSWVFYCILLISLSGALLHGAIDFPFQIYSVLFTFVIVCAMVSSCSRRGFAFP